jgi:hypothetical protein
MFRSPALVLLVAPLIMVSQARGQAAKGFVDRLDIPNGATAAYVGFNLHAHQLAMAKPNAVYNR